MHLRIDDDRDRVLLILLAGAAVVLVPVFFQRLYSDEVIFWEVARNIATGRGMTSETAGGGLFSWHMPLPFLIDAVFLRINPHIFVSRIVSAVFTVASCAIVYLAAREVCDRDGATVSALLFLFSFQVLRYGGRFYLDQYGVFFFLLSILFTLRDSALLSGIFALLAVLSREYWLLIYPSLLLCVRLRTGRWSVFLIPLLLSVTVLLSLPLVLGGGYLTAIESYFTRGAMLKNISAALNGAPVRLELYRLSRAWGESLALNILIVAGFTAWAASRKGRIQSWYLLVAVPQFIIVSMIHGFVVDGGVTQYTLGLVATLSVFSGPGLKSIYVRLNGGAKPGTRGFISISLLIVFLQFASFNIFSTCASLHKSAGVYGFGYSDDAKVIELLRSRARGAYILGVHGAFVDERGRWDWTDYRVDEAIAKEPDWLVTFSNYVDIQPKDAWKGRVELFTIGPYTVAHAIDKGSIGYAIRQRDFPRWFLRKR